jgi:spermidine/putrescine transport system permease protein
MIGSVIVANFAKEFLKPQMSALSFVLMALILAGVLVYARLLGTEDLA